MYPTRRLVPILHATHRTNRCSQPSSLLSFRVVSRSFSSHSSSSSSTSSSSSSPDIADYLSSALTSAHLSHVQQFGFAVIDDVLPVDRKPNEDELRACESSGRSPPSTSSLADRMREEILSLHAAQHMTLNHTHIVVNTEAAAASSSSRLSISMRSVVCT